MPDESTHLAIANHNQAFIELLLPNIADFSDWITTAAFYKALHVVEAVFFNDPAIRHAADHNHRENILKRERRFSHIYKSYRILYSASLVARYLSGGHASFSDYLTPDQVHSLILGHHLHQVEKSALRLLRNGSALRCVHSCLAAAQATGLSDQIQSQP